MNGEKLKSSNDKKINFNQNIDDALKKIKAVFSLRVCED